MVLPVQRSRNLRSQRARSMSASVPAPVGGWNARDALGAMDEMDAVTMQNYFPGTADVALRNGYANHVTGITGQVETLMAYAGATTNKLFAINAGGSIYDVTTAGVVGAAVVSGLSNGRWQYINVATSGGNFLYAVNGVDSPLLYDGTTWTAITGVSTPAVTGVTTSTLVHINMHKNRVWFVQKNTLKAWYLPSNAVGGAAAALDLSSVAQLGGNLVAMATWTIDAGYGVDDLAAFITDKGEVIVYRGTDVSSANTWALVGVWQMGAPIGRRCFMKYSGDLLIITQDGVVPMSGALQSSRVNPRVAVTDKIQTAMSQSATTYGGNFGWQLAHFAQANQLYLNVPIAEGDSQQQYVMNTITKAWCNFTGWEANCFEIFNDELFFGGNTVVAQAWSGLDDNDANIPGDVLQAFNYFRTPGLLKRMTMMRPTLLTDGTPATFAGVNVDFDTSDTTGSLSFSPTSYGIWDVGLWDTAIWGGSAAVQRAWTGANGIGYCFGTRLKSASQGITVRWVATDLVMEKGAVL